MLPFRETIADPVKMLRALKTKPEQYWVQRGERRVLKLFHLMAERVPAYKDFLKSHGVRAGAVKTIADFRQLPVTDKDTYLRVYPLPALCWDGKLTPKQWMIASTSGSTGKPFYFPRQKWQDYEFAFTLELLLRDFFTIEKKSTLFIDCFAMGVWIGGMYMYQALKYIADSGQFTLSIITPGSYKEEAIKAVEQLAGEFDQVIIGGYAPLVKDLLDDGVAYGLDWKKYKVKFFFAAEGFSETFRDYVLQQVGAPNPYLSSFNHYGTADLGTMSHETPLSILLRRLATKNNALYQSVFLASNNQPTLTQFIPEIFFFEEVYKGLVCSSFSGLPLVRYDLKDRGGIFTLTNAEKLYQEQGVDFLAEAAATGIDSYIWNLPFVYVCERTDLTVSIYSVNIYPECIRRSLETNELQAMLTGKFTMLVRYDERQNQYLEINLELKHGVEESERLRTATKEAIIKGLDEENSEWRDFYSDPGIRHKVTPRLVFWPYQSPTYFRVGAKQKWVAKDTTPYATAV